MNASAQRTLLARVQDLERLAARLAARKAGARDLKALERTLVVVPAIQSEMTKHEAVHALSAPLIDKLIATITKAIIDDAPVKSNPGGFIKDSYDEELDRLRRTSSEVQAWLEGSRPRSARRPALAP